MGQYTVKKCILKNEEGEFLSPFVIPASNEEIGTVKPDGKSIIISEDGTISSKQLEAGNNVIIENNVISTGISLPILTNISLYCSKDYVPKGCLPKDGAEYSEKLFAEFYKGYLKTGYALTCSYAEYEAEVVQYGQCGKFGVNTIITNICSNDNLIVGGNYNGDTSNIFTYKRNGDDELTISEYVSIDDSCANNNGIVSNFANGGVTINNINSNEVQFIVFETSEDVITEQHIVSFSNLYSLRISNGLLQLIQNDILTSSCVVEPNTKYTLEIINQTYFVIINGVTKKLGNDEYIFNDTININSSLVFGYGENQSPFLGSLFLTLSTYASNIAAPEADNYYATLIENGYWTSPDGSKIFSSNGNFTGSSEGLEEQYGISVIGTPQNGDTITFEEESFFRTPLMKDGAIIQQALSDSELGKSYNAGLPNIEGTFKADRHTAYAPTGAFYLYDSSGATGADDTGTSNSRIHGLDASLSNPIYGKSDTVQPNAVALRHFVVVANGQLNQSQMDWSEWASSLQGKANSDLRNVSISSGLRRLIEVSDSSLMPSWYKVFEEVNPQTGAVIKTCEQGGQYTTTGTSGTISLLKEYISGEYYNVTTSDFIKTSTDTGGVDGTVYISDLASSSFRFSKVSAQGFIWEAKGYLKE